MLKNWLFYNGTICVGMWIGVLILKLANLPNNFIVMSAIFSPIIMQPIVGAIVFAEHFNESQKA